jgi:hypothetical protein
MPVKPAIYEDVNKAGLLCNDLTLVSWTLASGDVGAPVKIGEFSDRTIQLFAPFSGSAIALRGSLLLEPDPENDTHWFVLNDPKLTTPLSNIVSAGGYVLYENPLFMSPKCTGGTATALKTSILGRKR